MSDCQRSYMGLVKGILNKNALSGNKQKEQQRSQQFNRDFNTNESNVSPVTNETNFLRPIEDATQQSTENSDFSIMVNEELDSTVTTKKERLSRAKRRKMAKKLKKQTAKNMQYLVSCPFFEEQNTENTSLSGGCTETLKSIPLVGVTQSNPKVGGDKEVPSTEKTIRSIKSPLRGSFPQKIPHPATKMKVNVETGPETPFYPEIAREQMIPEIPRTAQLEQMYKELPIEEATVLERGDGSMYPASVHISKQQRLSREVENTATQQSTENSDFSIMVNEEIDRTVSIKKKRMSGAQRRKMARTGRLNEKQLQKQTAKNMQYLVSCAFFKDQETVKTSQSGGCTETLKSIPLVGITHSNPKVGGDKEVPYTEKTIRSMKSPSRGSFPQNIPHPATKGKLNVKTGPETSFYPEIAREQMIPGNQFNLHRSEIPRTAQMEQMYKELPTEDETVLDRGNGSMYPPSVYVSKQQRLTREAENTGRYNNSREYRDNDQWPDFSPKFGNTALEMPKNPQSRILTPPPPPIIDWNDVVGRFSRDRNDNEPNRCDDNFQNKFGMDDQNDRRHYFIENAADKYDISIDRQDRNIRSWQLEDANEESWISEAYKTNSDNHTVGNPEQKDGFWKTESAFQNKPQSYFEQTQEFCRNEIDFDINENSADETIHKNFTETGGFSNPNNRKFKTAEGFWGLETGNDNTTSIDWEALARGDIRKNNVSMSRADDMDCDVTTKSYLNINTFEKNNLDEERVEVRIVNNGKIQCVSMITKQYERYKKALSLGFPISEALEFSEKGLKTIGLIPNNLKENPLGLHQMEQIENTILHYAAKWSVNTNLMSCYPQKGWLILLCNNGLVDMLQSHLPVIRNICKLNINLVTEGERIFPRGHSVHGYFPRSINYSTGKVLELIQAQNDITTTLWRAVGRSVEEGLVLYITFEVDDNSWSKLQELNGLIFYRFGKITLTLEESESNKNKNQISQLSTTTRAYTGNSKEISKPNVYDKPKPAIAQTNTPQHIQNATLLKLEKLKRDIATNMKLLDHARTLEVNVTSQNPNMYNKPAIAQSNTPQHIQNATLLKLDQLKKGIATNMKLLEHKRMLEVNDTTSYTGNSKEMYNKPAIAQTNTPLHIQNATLMKLDLIKKDIATNMKLLEHKRTLEQNVTSEHKNRSHQLLPVTADTMNPGQFSNSTVYKQPGKALANTQGIQNAKLNQSKKNIATDMKQLGHNRKPFRGTQFLKTTPGNSQR